MSNPPAVVNVHTPSSSFAIIHSASQESLTALYDKLSRKLTSPYHGQRVGPGWLKYQHSDSIWNLDDDSDYTIFAWRCTDSPTIHLHDPSLPLPSPPDYINPSYYKFAPVPTLRPQSPASSSRPTSTRSRKTTKSKRSTIVPQEVSTPVYKREFEQFQLENGVRTVMGDVGPVLNVRMLLREGYRHVYISRKFAAKHGFIPKDASLGHYGYNGLINIGKWPIRLQVVDETPESRDSKRGEVIVSVYLSEEAHFDVVLGRSFMEKRQIKLSPIDPTEVICMDNGDKLVCEIVILKTGRGDIVTVT